MSNLFREFVSVCFEGNGSAAAEALGLDRSMVSRICSGERSITPAVAAKVEAVSGGRFRKETLVWPDSEAA